MEQRDEEQELLLGHIIYEGGNVLSFLNDTDGLEAAGYDYDGSSDLMPVQELDREDGSGDPMPVQEGDREDGSGDPMPMQGDRDDVPSDRTESG